MIDALYSKLHSQGIGCTVHKTKTLSDEDDNRKLHSQGIGCTVHKAVALTDEDKESYGSWAYSILGVLKDYSLHILSERKDLLLAKRSQTAQSQDFAAAARSCEAQGQVSSLLYIYRAHIKE